MYTISPCGTLFEDGADSCACRQNGVPHNLPSCSCCCLKGALHTPSDPHHRAAKALKPQWPCAPSEIVDHICTPKADV